MRGGTSERVSALQKAIIKELKGAKYGTDYNLIKDDVFKVYGTNRSYCEIETYADLSVRRCPQGFTVSFSNALRNLEKKGYVKLILKRNGVTGIELITRYKKCKNKQPKIPDNNAWNDKEERICDDCPFKKRFGYKLLDLYSFYYHEEEGRCYFTFKRKVYRGEPQRSRVVDIQLTERGKNYTTSIPIEERKRIERMDKLILDFCIDKGRFNEYTEDPLKLSSFLEKKFRKYDKDEIWHKMWDRIYHLRAEGYVILS